MTPILTTEEISEMEARARDRWHCPSDVVELISHVRELSRRLKLAESAIDDAIARMNNVNDGFHEWAAQPLRKALVELRGAKP